MRIDVENLAAVLQTHNIAVFVDEVGVQAVREADEEQGYVEVVLYKGGQAYLLSPNIIATRRIEGKVEIILTERRGAT